MEKVTPFLMFQDGKAEEAMNYYISIIDDSEELQVFFVMKRMKTGVQATCYAGYFFLKRARMLCALTVM